MKDSIRTLIAALTLTLLTLPMSGNAAEGDAPYSPTKLEWATVYFRNECGLWFGSIPSVLWGLYNMYGTENTLTIKAIYIDSDSRMAAESAANTCEKNIKALAKDKGWTWLKVAKEIRPRETGSH